MHSFLKHQAPKSPTRFHEEPGFYWPDRSAGHERAEAVAPRNSPPLPQTTVFGQALARMIRACEDQSMELRKTPLDAISRTVRPSEGQQNALDKIRNAAFDAADMLAATCPTDSATMPSERLDTLRHAIDALAASRATLHPALADFYSSLDEEQKARIVVNFSSGNDQANPIVTLA